MTAQSSMAINKATVTTQQNEWALLYEQELPRIYNYFRYRLQDDQVAKDLTAVTFEKAWQKRNGYQQSKAAFTTWLFTIAKNVSIDHFRQQRLHVEIGEYLPANTPSPEDVLQEKENLAKLARLLDGLPEREQEIVALKYGASLNNREIARVTNLSSANVGIILFRTVRKLRRQWENSNG